MTGEKVDNVIKLEVLRQEETEIKLEKAAKEQAKVPLETVTQATQQQQQPVPAMKPSVEAVTSSEAAAATFADAQLKREVLVDKAKVLGVDESGKELLTSSEIKEINQMIESLPANEKIQVKAELAELKKDVSEYNEDVREVEELTAAAAGANAATSAKLTETKSAKRLSKRVQKLIDDMENLVERLERESAATSTTATAEAAAAATSTPAK